MDSGLNVVQIKWDDGQDPQIEHGTWNHTCAMIMEKFGLPGDKYVTHTTEDHMDFIFNDPKDATMCRLFLSERI
jgi:hypothetical protein